MTTIVAVTSKDLYRAAVIASRVENDFVKGLQVAKLNELRGQKKRDSSDFPEKSLQVPPQGLEPWTPTLRVSCSTN